MLETLIEEATEDITRAQVYNNKMLEKKARATLAHFLELKEHRKFHGIDKIIERYKND